MILTLCSSRSRVTPTFEFDSKGEKSQGLARLPAEVGDGWS